MSGQCGSGGCGSGSIDQQQREQDQSINVQLGKVKHKLLVMSGKGGVGKSSMAVYLAVALARRGYSVGLMDVDLHGPSIPRMLGLQGMPQPSPANKVYPVEYQSNLRVMSMESLLVDKDAATIWRGPVKIGVIRQFISDVDWGELDYLIIDSPPGTGDEPLTVAQTIPNAKAVVVTTPQEISLADVRKSINFCRQVGLEILGVIENMSGYVCPHCNKTYDLFKRGGGKAISDKMGERFLGALPLEPRLVQDADNGFVSILEDDSLEFTRQFNTIIDTIIDQTINRKNSAQEADVAAKQDKERKNSMNGNIRFAVPTAGGMLCAHFGHCEQFAIINTEDGDIKNVEMLVPPPHEPGVIPKWIGELGADIVIAGGMGRRAQDLFTEQGVKVVVGAPVGDPAELVRQYLSDSLETGSNTCDH